MRGTRSDERSDDYPPYSRLFIVCERNLKESDFQEAFQQYGTIEDIRIPRDHDTGEPKGVVYLKFSKTSEAAAALEAMNQKVMPNSKRPLKVMVACNRSDIQSSIHPPNYDEDKKRLFISTDASEDDIHAVFKQYGVVESVRVQKHRETGVHRGFAYVKFKKFSEAARAYEQSEKKFRAIFAIPKQRQPETPFQTHVNHLSATSNSLSTIMTMMKTQPGGFTKVDFTCAPFLSQTHVTWLFDIVPGLEHCHYFGDYNRKIGEGTVSYSNPISAAYAVEKLNNFEYPPGQRILVKPSSLSSDNNDSNINNISNIPDITNKLKAITSNATPDLAQLAKAVAEASKIMKLATGVVSRSQLSDSDELNYCSVALPPPQPLADIDSLLAKRCFLVCKPQPPPHTVLRDIFCRFGDLINVYTIPYKTVGYARYASVKAADEAIATLHGAEVCGIRIKVLEAEQESDAKKRRYDEMN